METEQSNTPQWAVIELMGHNRYGGLVSKDNHLGTAMLRVDVPAKDGSFISQLINPASIYRITFCEEKIARAAAESGQVKPFEQWELRQLLPAPESPEAEEDLPQTDDWPPQ